MVGGKWVSNFTPTTNGPRMISVGGTVFFSYNRKYGPSIIHPNGNILYTNPSGGYHRTNGPAIILPSGSKEYWVNYTQFDAEEFFIKYGVV